MTIRLKLILLYSGLLGGIVILFGVMVYAVNRWVLVRSVDTTLAQTVDNVWLNTRIEEVSAFGGPAQIVIFLPPSLDFFGASGVVVQFWRLDDVSLPQLMRSSSNLGTYSDPLDSAGLSLASRWLDARDPAAIDDLYSTVRVSGGDWRVLTLPHERGGLRMAIQAAVSFDTVNQASQGLLVIMLVSTGFALLGSVLLGWFFVSRVLRPIQDITRSAARIAQADDLKTRLPWAGPVDELGHLVSVFNAMMGRLEHLFSVQQRFVADVSHELRTPLTAISGHFDLIRRYGLDPMSQEAIDAEIKRMSRLVNDLLLLARADNGEIKLTRTLLDLDGLISEVFREAKSLAKDRALVIRMDDYEPVRVLADGDRLRQLLRNLLVNAVKFTPDGGTITLSLTKTPSDAIITVSDTGVGIAPEHLTRIFDRFYQADSSRVHDDEDDGAGLGLSIARWIAEAHGGKITVASTIGAGSSFTVTLPHAEPPEFVLSQAVTRPRLSLTRKSVDEPQHRP